MAGRCGGGAFSTVGAHEVSRRRWHREGRPDRSGHVAVRLPRMGIREPLCQRVPPATSCSALSPWASPCSTPPRSTGSARVSASSVRPSAMHAPMSRLPARSSPSRRSPRWSSNASEASARRLRLNRIPLYQIHQPNPIFPDSVIMPGMRSLLDSGRHRSGRSFELLSGAMAQADAALGRPVISNQVHFSLANSGPLDDLVPFAEREKRIVIAYSPLAQGLLGGKYGVDNRPGGVRATNALFGTENLRRIEPLLGACARSPRGSVRSRRRWRSPGWGACREWSRFRERPVSNNSNPTSPQPTSSSVRSPAPHSPKPLARSGRYRSANILADTIREKLRLH